MDSNYINCISINCWISNWLFLARKYMMDFLKKNPPINEEMLRMMMMQMGQKPSQKKINQMMTMMNKKYGSKYEKSKNKLIIIGL